MSNIPAYWTPGPSLVGAITFRVGCIDEAFLQRGITRLIERLVLSGLDPSLTCSGETGLAATTFRANGSPPQVAGFLQHVVDTLADLPWDRLAQIADELAAEREDREQSSLGRAGLAMYGPNHVGLIDSIDMAHERLDAAEIEHWRRTYFTNENCTLWFSGDAPPPVNLSNLPHGQRMASPHPARILEDKQWGIEVDVSSPVGVNEVARSVELDVALAAFEDRLTERLRCTLGPTYRASCTTNAYSGDRTFVQIATGAPPGGVAAAYEQCALELSELAFDGISDDEIRRFHAATHQRRQAPNAAAAVAAQAATNELLGAPVLTDADIIERLRTLDRGRVSETLADVHRSLVWLLPTGTSIADRRLTMMPSVTHKRMTGERMHPAKSVAKARRFERLIVTPEGFTFIEDDGRKDSPELTVLRTEIMGGYRNRAGELTLWTSTGEVFRVDPREWDASEKVAQSFASLVPAQGWTDHAASAAA